jgi:hypothetical protein
VDGGRSTAVFHALLEMPLVRQVFQLFELRDRALKRTSRLLGFAAGCV